MPASQPPFPPVVDLIGLNATPVTAMPIVNEARTVLPYLRAPLSIAGSRHSQGGHTMLAGAPMLLTEPLDGIVALDTSAKTITVQAGATWNTLHHALHPHGLTTIVQQSSAHFTVGGSLSVNCHGRDPRQGPVSSTVHAIQVLLAHGETVNASRQENADLFAAVLGGYGGCGFVTQATLAVCDNLVLKRQAVLGMSIQAYTELLQARLAHGRWPDLHFAWLDFSAGTDLFSSLLSVDYWPATATENTGVATQLHQDGWVENEWLQVGWAAGRSNPELRQASWEVVQANLAQTRLETRANALRQSVGFTAHMERSQTDILQEYFVPIAALPAFVQDLRLLLLAFKVNVLSSTLRIVQANNDTLLTYCPLQTMVSIALDVHIELNTAQAAKPTQQTFIWVHQAIELALAAGGGYYLPYYGFASLDQFKRAYPNHQRQRAAMQQFNPQRRFDNQFLQQYLA